MHFVSGLPITLLTMGCVWAFYETVETTIQLTRRRFQRSRR